MRFSERHGLYRSRKGWLLGVCRGLADYLDISAIWVRLVVVVMAVATGFWPVAAAYALAAVLLRLEPLVPVSDESEREFYESWETSRQGAVHRLSRKFDNLDRRIRRMEDVVVSPEFDWERRMNS